MFLMGFRYMSLPLRTTLFRSASIATAERTVLDE